MLRTIENLQYVYYELDAVHGRGRELTRVAWLAGILGDWALSSDGSKVAIPNHDAHQARIHVLTLDHPAQGPDSWDVIVPGIAELRGVQWAADDRGWFSSINVPTGVQLLYIDARGRSRALWESPIVTWGIPSPDGRRLAFVDQNLLSNIWRLLGL